MIYRNARGKLSSEKLRYCRKCGAFIPVWADKCLACGDEDIRRRHKEPDGGDINLSPLLGRVSKSKLTLGDWVLENPYIGDCSVKISPCYSDGRTLDGKLVRTGKTLVKLNISIIGETHGD